MKRRIRSELIIGGSILVLSVLFGNTSVNMWGLNAFSFSAGSILAFEDQNESESRSLFDSNLKEIKGKNKNV